MLRATTMEVISTLKELLHLHPLYNEQMRNFIQVGAGVRWRAVGVWGVRCGGVVTMWAAGVRVAGWLGVRPLAGCPGCARCAPPAACTLLHPLYCRGDVYCLYRLSCTAVYCPVLLQFGADFHDLSRPPVLM